MGLWYFPIATLIAAIGFLFIFKQTYSKIIDVIKRNGTRQEIGNIQTFFFLKHAVVDAVSIVLIVLGYYHIQLIQDNGTFVSAQEPLLFTIVTAVASLIILVLIKNGLNIKLPAQQRNLPVLKTLFMMELALLLAFPLVSIVGLLIVFV